MNEIEFDNFDIVLKKCKELGIIKNEQYGVKNLLIFDGFGILTRMNDKVARLNSLLHESGNELSILEKKAKESVNDTLLDLINYSVYLYLYKNNMLLKERVKLEELIE